MPVCKLKRSSVVGKIRPTKRPSAVKFQNNQGKRRPCKIPESGKKKKSKLRMALVFPAATLEMRDHRMFWRKGDFQAEILYPQKLSFKCKGRIKLLSEIQGSNYK